MAHIPSNQREKHPELYPILKDKEHYINHIYEMCDNANGIHLKKRSVINNIRNENSHLSSIRK